MNIVLIHYSAPPVVGGVETVLARQAQVLTRAGHRVRILTGRGETWDAQIPVRKIPLIDARHPHILKVRSKLNEGYIPDHFSKLVEHLEHDLRQALADSDVAILHNVASVHRNLPLTQALYQLSQSSRFPHFILWHHDLAYASPRALSQLHSGMPWELLRQPWPGVKQVTVSQTSRQKWAQITGLPEQEIQVISAGLTLPDFLGLNRQTLLLFESLQLALAAPLLLMPVRIARRKNLEQAITVLSVLRNTFPDAMLVITGPARGANQSSNEEYLKALKKLRAELNLKDAVHFLAESLPQGLPEASLSDFYRLADGLLLTSREESFGVPILEAGLSGIPIFCTRLPSLQELAHEDATYFSPGDLPNQVAAQIVERLTNDPVYRMRARVRREYTWDAVYRRQMIPLLNFSPPAPNPGDV